LKYYLNTGILAAFYQIKRARTDNGPKEVQKIRESTGKKISEKIDAAVAAAYQNPVAPLSGAAGLMPSSSVQPVQSSGDPRIDAFGQLQQAVLVSAF
jgi:hypothetical protein